CYTLYRNDDRRHALELAGPQRLAKRASRGVIVRDVDVLGIAAEPVRALTAPVPQPRRRLGLPLGPGTRFPLASDDLQGDVEAVLLVAGQPDGTGSTAAERAERAVPPEDELALLRGGSGVLHALEMAWLPAARDLSRPGCALERPRLRP